MDARELSRLTTSPSRESRLGAISAYLGPARALLEELTGAEPKQRIRTFSQTRPDDLIAALRATEAIADAVVVVHAPRGCVASQLTSPSGEGGRSRWATTDLVEQDTIMGAEAKLRTAILSLYQRHRPAVVFVLTAATVAINNDDVGAVVEELRERLAIPIVSVACDGLRSRCSVTGADAVAHALARSLLAAEARSGEASVNLLSLAEKAADVAAARELLATLGIGVNVLPRFAAHASFARVAGAAVSVALDPDSGEYLGKAIEALHGVPFVEPGPPIGVEGTGRWLEAVAARLGEAVHADAKALHGRECHALRPLLDARPLAGRRVYVGLPGAAAFAVSALATELGAEVVGLAVGHVDVLHRDALRQLSERGVEVRVGDGQPFEDANVLVRLAPDLYVGSTGGAVWAARIGVPALSIEAQAIIGYRGVRAFARAAARALGGHALFERLSAGHPLPYADAWLQKTPGWYIKQEVK